MAHRETTVGISAALVSGLLALGCRAAAPPPSSTPGPEEHAVVPSAERSTASAARRKPAVSVPGFVVLTPEATLIIPVDPSLATTTFPGLAVGAAGGARGHREVSVMWAPPSDDEGFEPGEVLRLPYCADEEPDCRGLDPEAMAAAVVHVDGRGRPSVSAQWGGPECSCVPVEGISTDPSPPLDVETFRSDPANAEELEMMSLSLYSEEDYIAYCVLGEESPEDGTEFEFSSVFDGVLYETGMGHEGSCSGLNIYTADERQTPLRPGATPRDETVPDGAACEFDSLSDAFVPEVMRGFSPDDADGAGCRYGEADCDGCDPDEAGAYMVVNGLLVQADGEIDSAGAGCSCVSAEPVSPAHCMGELEPCGGPEAFPSTQEVDAWWVSGTETSALLLRDELLEVRISPGDRFVRAEASPGDVLGVEFHRDTAPIKALRAPETVVVGSPDPDPDDAPDASSAKAWGNVCFQHFKAGRLEAAEGACIEALRQGGSSTSRGAVTYSLGRVAEARNNPARAARYYRRSLALRPGNDVVQQRLEQLRASSP